MVSMISILMPVYNNSAHLADALASVLSQRGIDWELLAVDDYSTDESLAILQAHAKQDPRIVAIPNTGPKGIIPALRLAFQHSSGAYITRMDADDLMPPGKLAALRQLIEQAGTPCIATGKIRYFADEGELGEGYKRYEHWLNERAEQNDHYQELYRECVLPSSAWMAARPLLEQAGGFERDVYPEDYDLCFRFYEQGFPIRASQACVHLWRDHAGRASRQLAEYADASFLELKLHYFLKLDCDTSRPLLLWGAGRKGKRLARLLQAAGQTFHWICNTPSKWGKDIYGQLMQPTESRHAHERPQLIIAVAVPEAQLSIRERMAAEGRQPGEDYFFFC